MAATYSTPRSLSTCVIRSEPARCTARPATLGCPVPASRSTCRADGAGAPAAVAVADVCAAASDPGPPPGRQSRGPRGSLQEIAAIDRVRALVVFRQTPPNRIAFAYGETWPSRPLLSSAAARRLAASAPPGLFATIGEHSESEMSFLISIVVLFAVAIVPIMIGARIVGARNTGFGAGSLSVLLLTAISAACDRLVGNAILGVPDLGDRRRAVDVGDTRHDFLARARRQRHRHRDSSRRRVAFAGAFLVGSLGLSAQRRTMPANDSQDGRRPHARSVARVAAQAPRLGVRGLARVSQAAYRRRVRRLRRAVEEALVLRLDRQPGPSPRQRTLRAQVHAAHRRAAVGRRSTGAAMRTSRPRGLLEPAGPRRPPTKLASGAAPRRRTLRCPLTSSKA